MSNICGRGSVSKVTDQEALETIGKLVREVQELRLAALALRVDPLPSLDPLTPEQTAEAEARSQEILYGERESWTHRIYTPPTPAGMAAVRHYSDECDQLRARVKVLEDRAGMDAERRSRDEADLKALRVFARGVLDHSFNPNPFKLAVYCGLLDEPLNPTRILTGDDPQIVANDDDTSNST